jgi:tRNA(Ile)-lysidine synthase
MINNVKKHIDEQHLLDAQVKHVYVAISGGVDSCVLLDILYRLRDAYNYKMSLLHFNHQTRGKDSLKDEQFVERLAGKYGLKLIVGRIHKKQPKMSETYLREQRLKFFEKTIAKKQDSRIATGHNLDDNIETFIMRLSKGSRLKGLLGIQSRRGSYIRPLLKTTRSEILTYARKYKIEYVEDRSNQDTTIIRNNIRHRVIPYLEKSLTSDLHQVIPKVMDELQRYHAIYLSKLEESIEKSTKKTKTGISLQRKRYLMYDETIRRGLVEYCISSVYPLNYKVSDRNLDLWDDFIENAQVGRKKLFLEEGMALAERQYIMFSKQLNKRKNAKRLHLGQAVKISETHQIMFQKVKREKISFTNDKNVEYIDGNKSGTSLKVRYWKAGDSFHPLGMSNKRKLSDFFTDLKVNSLLKKDIPLVCKDDNIIWISGYRLDNRFRVSEDTKTIYKLELREIK